MEGDREGQLFSLLKNRALWFFPLFLHNYHLTKLNHALVNSWFTGSAKPVYGPHMSPGPFLQPCCPAPYVCVCACCMCVCVCVCRHKCTHGDIPSLMHFKNICPQKVYFCLVREGVWHVLKGSSMLMKTTLVHSYMFCMICCSWLWC